MISTSLDVPVTNKFCPFFLPFNEEVLERTVTGTIVNQLDVPLAGHVVRLFDAHNKQLAIDTTGADGSFALDYGYMATSVGTETSLDARDRIPLPILLHPSLIMLSFV